MYACWKTFRSQTLREYIDWSPFFLTWELKGKYPRIFDDPKLGEAARKLFDDANELFDRIIKEKLLTARGVYGFWPAASQGDDIVVYARRYRAAKSTAVSTRCGSSGNAKARTHSIHLPTLSRPSRAGERITSARLPSPPASAPMNSPRASTANTTITIRS